MDPLLVEIFVYTTQKINNYDPVTAEAHCPMVLLLQQYGLCLLNYVTVSNSLHALKLLLFLA
jgi:hypothetical protein